uniref:Uncharacterized protein n=1 Tax=Anguilla anguilla TaxID=7936 RepID=A0A0E9SBT2_ANGAN
MQSVFIYFVITKLTVLAR